MTQQLSFCPLGYTVWAHNLIAIARLRGSDLKVLEVTEESIDFDQGELADQDVDPVHNLIEQVSLGLGRPWHAVMDIELLSVFTEPTRHFYREMQSFSEGIQLLIYNSCGYICKQGPIMFFQQRELTPFVLCLISISYIELYMCILLLDQRTQSGIGLEAESGSVQGFHG